MRDLIGAEIQKIRRKYLDSAEEIVSGYNREKTLSKDYEGRQIFELLQNADDEATGSGGKVLITFDGQSLSVSNTGNPFTFQGIKSLLYPNASPKKIHANKIGCKGLGFRSILTWAESVTVASREFTIQFSRDYAQTFLRNIIKERPGLESEIKTLEKEEWPIATLTCPHLLDDDLLVEGYATSILMECYEGLSDVIEKQIKELEFEELVFLPHLNEVEISCNGYHKTFFKVVEGNEVIIEARDHLSNEVECASWKLYQKTGTILDDKENERNYEFIIAYDSQHEHSGEVLYSYFKTDVKFGFPALVHGTFELTSDRNKLQKQSEVNERLIPMLADFMVQTAVEISEERKECDYRPLSLVISSDIDYVLCKEYHFDELLKEKIREKKILPTIEDRYISVNDSPKYSKYPFSKHLNPSAFSNTLKQAENEKIERFICRELGISFYNYAQFCYLLNADIDFYDMEGKIELIGCVDHEFRLNHSECFPHLLVDSKGESICDLSKVYPFPEDEQVMDLPKWVEIKFLNRDMEEGLRKKHSISGGRRGLVAFLDRYNLEEYSFEKILRGVVNQIDGENLTKEKCTEIIRWLWKYFNEENHKSIQDIRVKVICRDGSIKYAKDCYLGSEYGNELGEKLIKLFSDSFVAYDKIGIDCGDTTRMANFMVWLGVSKYPRLVKIVLPQEERKDFCDYCSPLYVKDDNQYYDNTDFREITNVTVGSFEHLDTIVEQADFNDVLAWMLLDEEFTNRISCETEGKNEFSCISGSLYLKRNERMVSPEDIKSYLRYYFTNKEWIVGKGGIKRSPLYSCFEELSLSPFIIVPDIDYGYINNLIKRNCKKDVESILEKIGVADVFQEMDKRVIYETFLKLPSLDQDCKKGRSLYRKIIREGLSPEEYQENNHQYDAFIREGKVVAKRDKMKRYVKTSEVRYADKKVFSEEVLRSFNMLDIDARSGEEKVRKLFGVQPLKYTNIEIQGNPKIHPLDEAFRHEYVRFLPFVFACRMGNKNSKADLRKLKTSHVKLCSEIAIKYGFGDESKISHLGNFETVYLRKENTAYLCVLDNSSRIETLCHDFQFADSVSEIIAMILDVNEDREFYRDLFRETDMVREMKMETDKGDENKRLLLEARRCFDVETNSRDEFWISIAEAVNLKGIEITTSNADELIKALKLRPDIDSHIKYDELSSVDNFEELKIIFEKLSIDLEQYNCVALHGINYVQHWRAKLSEKMGAYKNKYCAYLYEEFKTGSNGAESYEGLLNEYIYLEPQIDNSFYVNIDSVFENECGVSFSLLDKYSETAIEECLSREREKMDPAEFEGLRNKYSSSKLEALLLFNKGGQSMINSENDNVNAITQSRNEENIDGSLDTKVSAVLNLPARGFAEIDMKAVEKTTSTNFPKGVSKHKKRAYSMVTEKKKQEIGLIGEAFVYKELSSIYSDVLWVSGNAERANHIVKGDDSCGYDIKYKDENGEIQFVEVKASTSDDIVFMISENELNFGYNNRKNYEIIFVVVGDDGMPADKPWRLGHLFDFEENEDLFHNKRFSIENDGYKIVAKVGNNSI